LHTKKQKGAKVDIQAIAHALKIGFLGQKAKN
jgi:hypothetical protein